MAKTERVRGEFERLVLKNLRLSFLTKVADLEREIVEIINSAYKVMWSFSSKGFGDNPFSGAIWAPLKHGPGDGFFFDSGHLKAFMTGRGVARASLGPPKVTVQVGSVVLKPLQVARYFTSNKQSVLEALGSNKVRIQVEPFTNLSASVARGGKSRGSVERQLFSDPATLRKLTNPRGLYRNLVPNFLSWYLKNVIKTRIRKVTRG